MCALKMSFIYKFLFIALISINTVLSAGLIETCKQDDWDCLRDSLNAVLPTVLSGIPSLGIESSDPLHVDEIKGNLTTVQYVVKDVISKGFSKCSVKNVRGDLNTLKFHLELFCPGFEIISKYEISGRLSVVPIEGNGDFFFTSKGYRSDVEGELKKIEKDGKTYVAIKSIKMKNEPLAPLTFKYTNLFNGHKELSNAVHKFVNENWKLTAELLQDPVFYGNMKKVINNVNKFLKNVSVDEIMSN